MKTFGILKTTLITVSSAAMAATFTSCVSVSLGPKQAGRSKGVAFSAPEAPFQQLDKSPADHAWQNPGTGNSISYYSTCNDPADPSLESVAGELFSGMESMQTINRNDSMFDGREAIREEVEGKIDGVETRVRAIIFKKNDCIYTLSYIGLPKTFAQDQSQFNAFTESFQAP